MIFYRSLSDKSPQLSRILLTTLAFLNNAVILMVSTHPVIPKSSTPCTHPLLIVQSVQLQLVSTLFIIIMILLIWDFFPISISRFFSIGVWVTASLLNSPWLLNSPADLNNAIVWMVSIRLRISLSSSPCTKHLNREYQLWLVYRHFYVP